MIRTYKKVIGLCHSGLPARSIAEEGPDSRDSKRSGFSYEPYGRVTARNDKERKISPSGQKDKI